MKEQMYVIATRGKSNKEVYLKCSDKETKSGRIMMEWTEDINEAMATFEYSEAEECAKNHFKNYNKWYIKAYMADFS